MFHLQKQKSDVSDDPAKRYFNAFPALSDQSQSEYSHKKAAWPHVGTTASSGSNQQPNAYPSSSSSGGSGSASGSSASSSGASVTAAKKKTKRRRVSNPMVMPSNCSQTDPSKSATHPPMQMQSSKVSSSTGADSGSGAAAAAAHAPNSSTRMVIRTANQTKSNQRKKPTDMWDTDFDGAWEMGRDLIREFVLKQNTRNRSVSECETVAVAAAASSTTRAAAAEVLQESAGYDSIDSAMDLPIYGKVDGIEKQRSCTLDDDEENLMRVAAAATTALFGKNFDMNLYAPLLCDSETVSSSCSRVTTDSSSNQLLMLHDKAMQRSEGYSTPDTLASWNEIEAAVTPRRDYESMQYASMDGCNAKLGYQIAIDSGSDCVDSGCDENTCLAAFEAKFDRNVEALWNDCKPSENDRKAGGPSTMSMMMMDGQHSFWFDYDNQITHKNASANVDQFKQFFQTNPNAINSYAMHSGLGAGATELNDRSGFVNSTNSASSTTASSTIGGMSLTSTIWTDTPNNNEDDVSFYANARLWEKNQAKAMGRTFNVSTTKL